MPDSPAVDAYRRKFLLNCSVGRKHDIDLTVTDLELWKTVLNSWGYWSKGKWKTFSPLSINKMLSEYERLERLRSGQSALAYASSEARDHEG